MADEHAHPHPCLCNFSPDEREIIRFIAARIDKARAEYGPLDIDNDPRDWLEEAHLENVDKTVYETIEYIKKKRKRTRKQEGK